ncbi:GNAT family N-acetyltransferase [Myroides odoratus]|uniref:GNAT family N-acetyltransferase n=1 Tax=Myroides odoratus TaxID=256 RepID=UPI0007659B00|nr:GNAT family N-acetyltransferase [Myroides odoratus]
MERKQEFSTIVNAYWQLQTGITIAFKNDSYCVFLNEDLDKDYEIMIVEGAQKENWVIMRLDLLKRLGKENIEKLDFVEFKRVLEKHHILLHGADYVFYFSAKEKNSMKNLVCSANIRALTKEDASYFAKFEASATAQDLDDAAVALDHWKVYGAFEGNQLVAVASMYPWDEGSLIGDMGVLTLPSYRGKGYAKKVIEMMSQSALAEGYEPQYRCQLDNSASVGLAKKLNLDLFALWNVSIK